ncbi:MAG: SGNH/GDSL hydrolase family protein [Ruminococcaceae bacterium]|nr:SGNH/GDSL hydrolase family protein [Oscillospiraceae bacterium]
MRLGKRILAITLALMMLPTIIFSTSAENVSYGEADFEDVAVGKTLEIGDGFGGVPAISSVREESGNRYVRIPFVGEAASSPSSNWDKSLTAKHDALNSGDSFTFEVSYRPHFNGTENVAPTVEAQFSSYTFRNPNGKVENGIFMNLYKIDLVSGKISGCGDVVEGAEGLVSDAWNTVKLVFYPNNSTFKLYVNDALYSVQSELAHVSAGFANTYYGGCTDVSISSDRLILAKCNKNQGAYVSAEEIENASYIDVDNIRIYETEKVNYTYNGTESSIGKGSILDLTAGGKKLLWANIELANGEQYQTTEPLVSVEEGMKIDAAVIGLDSVGVEARLCKPLGIRFLTSVNLADLEALRTKEGVQAVELGTLIVPTLSIGGIGRVTHETVKKVAHAEVLMQDWYSKDEKNATATFAGSIANISEENYNCEFSGVGYIKILFEDESEMFIYASEVIDSKNTSSITNAASKALRSWKIKGEAKDKMEEVKKLYEDDATKLYGKDMNGLNVLALGDSLFSGTIGYEKSAQWVNKLGLDCGWNLTNLGIGSMTVSLTERNNVSAWGNKNSMYDWYFNNKNDFRWGSTAKGVSPNEFFTCGNVSGKGEDVDLIILEGGCNDYGTAISAPLGTVDSTDPSTFLGAWNCIVDRLMVDYPNATIVFVTSWRLGSQTRAWDTLSSIEFSESVIKLYNERYSDNPRIALIDAGNPAVSGVNMLDSTWRNTYSTDSYHLKDTGMAIMAENMLPLLWKIAKNTGKIS